MSEKRKPDAWMPLYVGDYLRDTSRLTTTEHGAYLLLIFDYWVNGPLPDEDYQLAAVTRSSARDWKRLRPVMARFFQIADGMWRHKRIDQELENTTKITEQRRNAGAASAEARRQRALNENPTNVATELFTDEQRNARPSPSQSPSQKKERSARSPRAVLSQDELREFEDWYQHYPSHVGRGAAERAFLTARKLASLQELIDGAKRYVASITDAKFTANPATWLNQRRWEDEPGRGPRANGLPEPSGPKGPPPPPPDGWLEPGEGIH